MVPDPLLICPVDRSPLQRTDQAFVCSEGHRWPVRRAAIDFEPNLEQARPFGFWQSWLYDWTLPWLSLPRVFGVTQADLQRLHDEAVDAASGGILVDVPCGTGAFLSRAHGLSRVKTVAALDLSSDMLALAAHRLPGARLVRADLRALPLREASANVLISTLGLQFVPEEGRIQALSEIRRALAPGGLFIGTAPALGLDPRYDRRYETRKVKDFPLDAGRWPSELAEAGFAVHNISYTAALVVWRAH